MTWRPKLTMNVVMPIAVLFFSRSITSSGVPVGQSSGAPAGRADHPARAARQVGWDLAMVAAQGQE